MGTVVKKKLTKNESLIVNPTTLAFWESTVDTKVIRPNGSTGDIDEEYWTKVCNTERDKRVGQVNKEYESDDNLRSILFKELSELDDATLLNRARTQYNITSLKGGRKSIINLILDKANSELIKDKNSIQAKSMTVKGLGGKVKGGWIREKKCAIPNLEKLEDKEDLEERLEDVNNNLNMVGAYSSGKAFLFGNETGFLLKVTGPGLIIINGRRYTKSELNNQIYSSL